ncbi:MAG TPA: glycosyltransferase WbuB [Anaerolineae bacterium]|nr:glycosyltransferase WbuB [Anaerolineae bacterium]
MRILLLSMYFPPDPAASAVLAGGLARELQALGHELSVVTSFPHYDTQRIWPTYRGEWMRYSSEDDMEIFRCWLYLPKRKDQTGGRLLSWFSFNLVSTLAALRTGPQDVILAPSPPLTIGLSARWLARRKHCPYVYNVQDIYPDVAINAGMLRHPRLIQLARYLEDTVYAGATRITVITPAFAQNLKAKGVPAHKLAIIPNFVDVDFLRPGPRKNGFAQEQDLVGRFVVLYAGNVGLSQGLETLLEAANLLRTTSELLILIVGDGAAKKRLQRQAEAMQLPNVRFLPFQSQSRLPDIYASANVGVVLLRQGLAANSFPSKLYSIMAAGRPVVAALDPESDAWQLVHNAESGLTVPPEDPTALADALLTVYRDREQAQRFGQNGRRYVTARHSSQLIARQYDVLLRSIVTNL